MVGRFVNHIEKTGYKMVCDTIAYNIKKMIVMRT